MGAPDQRVGIPGQPRRLGGDGTDARHTWCFAMRSGTDFPGRRWCGPARLPTKARSGLTPSPSRTMRESESHHPEATARRRRGDQEATVVGAEVEHRQKRPGVAVVVARIAASGIVAVSVHFSPWRAARAAAAAPNLARAKARRGTRKGAKTRYSQRLGWRGPDLQEIGGWSKGAVPAGALIHSPDGGSSNGRAADGAAVSIGYR